MFLAMTEEEIQSISSLPSQYAYLGCHFSADGSALEGLPKHLPQNCGIILDDRHPIPPAEPDKIIEQLAKYNPPYILLDFRRPPTDSSMKLSAELARSIFPSPMPPDYGKDLNCPLFLSPIPPHIPIEEYLQPWHDREIWLELALDAVQIDVTSRGSQITYFPHAHPVENAHKDSMLHCHYKITQTDDALSFYCCRTPEDLWEIIRLSLPQNVTHTIGLYQELGNI